MKLSAFQFGEIEFDESMILRFTDGIIGFENLTEFLLITREEELFAWLTSVKEPEMVFPLFPVRLLINEYPETEENVAYGIVRLDKDPAKITVNLKAPIYINAKQMTGYQKIIDTDKYPINYQLFVEN